jgi:hypothetical protein
VPGTNIVFGGSGSNRTVTVTVAPNQGGVATITVNVDNGLSVASEPFDLTVVGALVAWYQLEGNALDSSGHGNNGTTGGGVSFVAGKVGAQAISTDGTSGFVQIPVSILNDFTIALWLKTTAVGGAGQWWAGKGIVDGEVGGTADDFGTALVNNNFAFGMGNPDTTIVSTSSVNDGSWHHVAATRNAANGQMKVYVDGALQMTGVGPTAPRTAPPSLRIGSIQTGSGAGFLAATLDDVRLYNFALNAAQIGSLANTPPVLPPISNRTILAGATLLITNTATDADAPPQVLTYSLVGAPSPPVGANINSSNGQFSWRPAIAQAGTTNLLNVKVSDNGVPTQTATQAFSVTVTRPAKPTLTSPALSNGQFKLLVSGDAGPDYTIQASTNLVNWVSLSTNNSAVLPFVFTDPSATNFRQRFYRVLLGP